MYLVFVVLPKYNIFINAENDEECWAINVDKFLYQMQRPQGNLYIILTYTIGYGSLICNSGGFSTLEMRPLLSYWSKNNWLKPIFNSEINIFIILPSNAWMRYFPTIAVILKYLWSSNIHCFIFLFATCKSYHINYTSLHHRCLVTKLAVAVKEALFCHNDFQRWPIWGQIAVHSVCHSNWSAIQVIYPRHKTET